MSFLALPLVVAHVVAAAAPPPPPPPAPSAPPSSLVTVAERSGFVTTGRYDEVLKLCEAFARVFPKNVRCESFGTTPEGRDMKSLVLSDDVEKAADKPVILAQGGIHAGEIDGKDAGFWLARDLLEGKVAPNALKSVTFVFVPVFNIDGHERFGKNNRPNQRGPAEMGWRTTSWNLNLNRDYVKAEAPEMQAMIRLLNKWNPVLYIDLHVTDGAQFQHDVAVMVDARRDPLTGKIAAGAAALQQRIIATLNSTTRKDIGGHKALDFYPSFEKHDDPMSGAGVGSAPPRFSQTYWATRGGAGILVETHSWKDYQTRVKATRDVLVAVLEDARDHVAEWRPADAAAPLAPGTEYTLAYDNADAKITIDFQGYEYTRELSAVSGALATRYDEKKPAVWKMPFFTSLKPTLTVKAPRGYLVPCGHAVWMKDKLTLHGLDVSVVDKSRALKVEEYVTSEVTFGAKPYESRTTAKVKGAWRVKDKHTPRACDLFVKPTPLALHLFEPNGPDSFVSWGYFNAIFEQKEYMEPYVAEAIARDMLKDPKVREEFSKKLEDPAFASDAEARLDFFYRKHPSFDARMNVYPVLRVIE